MKQFRVILFAIALSLLACSCNSLKPINFANREWHISEYYGQIIDRDTTYRMTFGNVIIPENPAIISCADSAAKYPGMGKFLAEILKTSGLENDEVLFYSPDHGKIFVRLTGSAPAKRPSSVSADMDEEHPYTMWVYEDDMENWNRKRGEMYTYTYFDRKKQRVLVVDYYDYGDTPIAEVFVIQSRAAETDKMQLPAQGQLWDFSKHKLKDYERDIEFWSHQIDIHRENAFANYKIGREQQKRGK